MMHLNLYICSNSGLSIIHVHTLTNNPSRKHRSIRLNLTFEISHKESSKDKKNEIMLRLTFEGLADQIRIQHWQGRNFICRSGWILLNTPNKNDLDFLMLWCKGRELGYFRLLCKENLCVNVERALKSAELSKRMLYPHHKQHSSGQINQGKNYLTTKRLCVIGRKLIFWPKINLRRILFFPLSATQGLDSVSLLTERLKQNCMFSTPPTPSIFPQKQMRPRQESAEEIHTAWIRNTSTSARHQQPCCFRNCILHLCEKKEPVVIKYQNWEKKKKNMMTWLQSDSQINFMIISKQI